MTYYELIELYKNGKLDGEQKETVKRDIERQEAISDYLFESEEIPSLEDLKDDTVDEYKANTDIKTDKNNDEANNFTKMIRSYIRRAFIKMGVIVGTTILAITLFVIFGLPKVVDTFYYNPAQIAGEEDGFETNQISLDWATYSEMFLPGYYRCQVLVDEMGYGEYNINIKQFSSVNGVFDDVSGHIDKGNLVLYNNYVMKRPTGDAFVREFAGVEDYYFDNGKGPAGSVSDALAELEELNDDDYYVAYLTMDEVMTYNQFNQWSDNNEVSPWWCAICQKTDNGYYAKETLGFNYSSSALEMQYDKEKYPNLSYFDTTLCASGEDWVIPEEAMKKHMVSMLRYMDDQKDFRSMIEYLPEDGYLEEWAKNVEENGLNIYGFVVVGKKDEIIKLSQLEDVAYVYTSLLQ